MITIQQTVDIPASRRLTIDVPQEVPTGTTSVVLIFPSAESGTAVRPSPTFPPFPTLEELKAEAARKAAERQAYFNATGKDPLVELRDSMNSMPFAGIDGVEYQRKMRDEWPD
ncbi:hypothetical protein AGMMS49944_10630 [Spirochaetia bacterium]|nr:hypothetical protein AGMMS49944_10630 [Spirochaetia bacterium]